jgi:uncharacterized protein (DUF2336 family)
MPQEFIPAGPQADAAGSGARRARLTQEDVSRLLSDPSPMTRAETAAKLAVDYSEAELNAGERRMAQDIFTSLVRDSAVLVREALAEHLKHAADLPRDLAVTLAKDVDSVALPILRESVALTDADLIEIVREAAPRRIRAIAQRANVSEQVSQAVIDTGEASAVADLVGNEGAMIAEADFSRVLEEFAHQPAVGDQLARRGDVPPAVAEKLVSRLSTQLRDALAARGDLDADTVSDLVLQVRDRAVLQIADRARSVADLDRLVEALAKRERLTDSLVLRALCAGDLAFFEAAMARLADVPVPNARVLIYDAGPLGLASLYRRAGLAESKLPIFRAAVDTVVETDYDGGPNDRSRFAGRLLERLLTHFDQEDTWPGDDLDYLIGRLTRVAA